jgi:hypothetical protein
VTFMDSVAAAYPGKQTGIQMDEDRSVAHGLPHAVGGDHGALALAIRTNLYMASNPVPQQDRNMPRTN